MAERLSVYAGFVKLEHTIFSLPLIVAGAWLGAGGWPAPATLGWIAAAAVGGRVVAMGLNRLIDRELDARNPRTRQRELPRHAMTPAEAWGIVLGAGALYVAAAVALGPVCARLAPIPVALFVVYPYLKRVTSLAHLGLGLAWAMAPLGGWLAARGSLSGVSGIGWLWLFSVLWVTGFDIIYATMDEAFDRDAGLHSLPARVGSARALRIAAGLHGAAWLALLALWRAQLGGDPAALPWLAGIAGLFLWQHAVAARRPVFAFLHLNGVLGFLVLGFTATAR